MMKHLLSIILSCIVAISLLANSQIDELHDEIDAEQVRIDGLDGTFDGAINLENRDDGIKATRAFIEHINSIQQALRDQPKENERQVKYFLRALRNELRHYQHSKLSSRISLRT